MSSFTCLIVMVTKKNQTPDGHFFGRWLGGGGNMRSASTSISFRKAYFCSESTPSFPVLVALLDFYVSADYVRKSVASPC